jgi:DNA mismatch endonuclease (patch repair protein)
VIDVVDAATRSRMMSGIRGKNTQPEVRLRSALHRRGFRFRVNKVGLPGRPDIVLASRRAVVLVHGCFWHRHDGCRFATTPATRRRFWTEKFGQNVERDARNLKELEALGWRVWIVWECEIRKDCEHAVDRVARWLDRGESTP